MFFPTTGTPIRNIVFIKSSLAEAEPVPLTVPIFITKSLTPAVRASLILRPPQNLGRQRVEF